MEDLTEDLQTEEKKITTADALNLIEQERRERRDACIKEIESALAKYNCGIVPRLEFVGTEVQATWIVGVLR